MADDADWLKKNPHGNMYKMSLRRSSRFYTQDMDGSIMTVEDRSKKQGLIIPPMPRRSIIPLDKIKEMNFKVPGPVQGKGRVTKPVTRIQKNKVPSPTARPSLYLKAGQNKNGKQVKTLQEPMRYSMYCQPGPSVNNMLNSSVSMLKASHKVAPVTAICNRSGIKNQADISLLSQSKVVDQSTPNEPALLHSILKQKENSQRNCNASFRKSLKAVKRVNFSGDQNDNLIGRENKDASFNENTEAVATASLPVGRELTVSELDDDSTTAFSNSFKPITYEDVEIHKPVDGENKEEVFAEGKKEEFNDTCVVRGGMSFWKTYRDKVRDMRTQCRSVNENLQNTLAMCSDAKQVFMSYERDKGKLYEQLRSVEMKLREDFAKSVDFKMVFSSYAEKMEQIFKSQEDLEESFDKSLRTLVRKYVGGDVDAILNDMNFNLEETKRKNSTGNKTKRNSLSRRRNCGSQKKTLPETRDSDDYTSGTPENTPARQRKLSRKIENQLRSLFEE